MDEMTTEALIQIVKSLGVPGAWLLVLGLMARRLIVFVTGVFHDWVVPHVEKCLDAYQKRQETMAECQKQLTESTIEIQRENRDKLDKLGELLPHLCLAKCPHQTPPPKT